MGDDFGDDDPTILDGTPLTESGEITPIEPPRCTECGAVVFEDDFDQVALAIGLERCVRSRPGAENPWWWCANYSPTHRKCVQLYPR